MCGWRPGSAEVEGQRGRGGEARACGRQQASPEMKGQQAAAFSVLDLRPRLPPGLGPESRVIRRAAPTVAARARWPGLPSSLAAKEKGKERGREHRSPAVPLEPRPRDRSRRRRRDRTRHRWDRTTPPPGMGQRCPRPAEEDLEGVAARGRRRKPRESKDTCEAAARKVTWMREIFFNS